MNREAVAVGIPAFTYFTGELGALDKKMEKDNLIIRINDLEDMKLIECKKYAGLKENKSTATLNYIIDLIESELVQISNS